ncbi:hypothetical protein GH714_003663 [Hevea brasiliensis]|uniref:Protein SCAR n=1 Tax=Hevea brasiliensis TaxID=3981 RepID=A0A6A6LXS5_HEVBR|nr:hypothetical protein GH714_003663 [Hevea brasiliensis]
MTQHISVDFPAKSESHVASDISPNKGMVSELPISIPSNTVAHEHTSNINEEPSSSDNIGSSASADALDGLEVESVVNDLSSSGHEFSNLIEPLNEKTVSRIDQVSRSPKIQESAKTQESAKSQESPRSHESAKSQESPKIQELAKSQESPKSQESQSELSSVPSVSFWTNGGLLGLEPSKPPDFAVSNTSTQDSLTRCKDVKATSFETSQENVENSAQMFGLGNRLLINGLRKKMSLVPDNKPEVASSLKTSALEQGNGNHSFAYNATPGKALNAKFGHKSIVDSLTSSPPLEHMKMSFHPVDGFEASKLKLKFPDGNHSSGSFRDMFPSFQLIISLYVDDCLSHHSDSYSEQWESGESPENQDRELSISPLLARSPSFDAVNPVPQEKAKDKLDPRNLVELQNPRNCNPAPPPPPPVQWWVTKPASCMAEEKQNTISDAVSEQHAADLKLSGSTISQQHKPAPDNEQQTDEEAITFKPKSKQDHCQLNAQKEVNLPPNGKGLDEKEDFLHQIRAKSFTLRRTVTAKPTFTSVPATNDKVSAILEKANAIRQAVGSDDGEDDDTWSDT